MILLQTVPFAIDIDAFQKEILDKFPEIHSIHELHLWELTHSKYVATAHVIFDTPETFKSIINEVINFFHEQDINIVTIQPEFKKYGCSANPSQHELVNEEICLVTCRQATCEEKLCCQRQNSNSPNHSLDSDKCDHASLEQVISVRNLSAEELSAISMDSIDNKRSLASLQIPPQIAKSKLHKTASATDQEHHNNETATTSSDSGDIHLVSFKRVVSESVIKSDEHDVGRKASEILVENRIYQQTNNTDNNETEDIHAKVDQS